MPEDGMEKPEDATLVAHVGDEITRALCERDRRLRGAEAIERMANEACAFLAVRRPAKINVAVSRQAIGDTSRIVIRIALPDQPFLVDSLRLNLTRLGLRERLLLHPTLRLARDEDGTAVDIGAAHAPREAYLYAEASPAAEGAMTDLALTAELERVFGHVRSIVADHGALLCRLRAYISTLDAAVPAERDVHTQELMEFLYWLAADNFVFLGYRHYDVALLPARQDASQLTATQGTARALGDESEVAHGSEGWVVSVAPGTGLGLLRDKASSRFSKPLAGDDVPALIQRRFRDHRRVFFDKSNTSSIVHREGRLDTISIKTTDASGRVCGYGKFLGLLTHQAVRTRPSEIPIVRRRRETVLMDLAEERGSHTYKAAIAAFDSLPLELHFAFGMHEIGAAIRKVLQACEERSIEVVVLPDPQSRSFFVSVILPRTIYRENLRADISRLLVERYAVSYLDHRTSFVDDECALIHLFCTCRENIDETRLDALFGDVKLCALPWEERLDTVLLERHAPEMAYALASEYRGALPGGYRVLTPPEEACHDLAHLELIRSGQATVELSYRTAPAGDHAAGARAGRPDVDARAANGGTPAIEPARTGAGELACLKIYQAERPYLTDLLPLLDEFGMRVMDARLTEVRCRSRAAPLWIGAFDVERLGAEPDALCLRERHAIDGLRRVLSGAVEADPLNRLILHTGMSWREVDLLRAYLAYAAQLGAVASRKLIAETLSRYPAAARGLVARFAARFGPDVADRSTAESEAARMLAAAREPIPTAEEDRIFALLDQLIASTVRTSYYSDTPPAPQDATPMVVLKIDPAGIDHMPHPRPWKEIFVHSVEMSGVHLRGGPISRGGVRWSDRAQDFRQETLGLMKTQMVKNGLIVPVGAKGGFVLRRRFDAPAEARAEADRQYARFIAALLQVTDNVELGQIVPPPGVVRHDGDDPYLVVAADKGTAHLSDTANRVAAEARFWLRDAFASGGSDGYDHKAYAITARGAWACVVHHFRQLGMDVESGPFSIVGIGDMSGDVFGNGLRLARNGRLLAAFNHQHIFIDPDPAMDRATAERERLFALPRSSWRDYDKVAISAGGGVFDRSAKRIVLSPQAQALLDVRREGLSGDDLVRAILRMRVDLLWNGGIGTYVKSREESHADVADRANDGVRVDGGELGARVVAEGGNLGFTQRGRVEYALAGGRINTDAVDNSGGVDLSDHEVNFKILLEPRVADGSMSHAQRRAVLRECADAACRKVIAHNEAHAHALSVDRLRSNESPERMATAARFLARHAGLDPRLEGLPTREELRARSKPGRLGFTRPELAVLLGYSKLLAKRALAEWHGIEHPAFLPAFLAYFPERLAREVGDDIYGHALRRQITATALTNRVLDHAGVTLLPELYGTQGAGVAEVVVAYDWMAEMLGADAIRLRIESQVDDRDARLLAHRRAGSAVRIATRIWLGIERGALLDPAARECWKRMLDELRALVPDQTPRAEQGRLSRRVGELLRHGVPEPLAVELEHLPRLVRSLGAISLAVRGDLALRETAWMHARIGEVTRIEWTLERIGDAARRVGWERVAAEGLMLELLQAQRELAARLVGCGGEARLAAFRERHTDALARIRHAAAELEDEERRGLAALTALGQMIRQLLL
jgi:glutamate dehydrogenase